VSLIGQIINYESFDRLSCAYWYSNPRDNPDIADCLIYSAMSLYHVMVSFSGQLRPVWQNLTKIMLKNLSIKVCQLYAAGRSDIDLGNKKNILKKNWACMCRTWNPRCNKNVHPFTSSSELELPISNSPRSQQWGRKNKWAARNSFLMSEGYYRLCRFMYDY